MTTVWKAVIGSLGQLLARWFELDLPKFIMVACGLLIVFVGLLLGGANLCVELTGTNPQAQAIEDHESRIRLLEKTTTTIETDVKWVRRALEGWAQHGPPAESISREIPDPSAVRGQDPG